MQQVVSVVGVGWAICASLYVDCGDLWCRGAMAGAIVLDVGEVEAAAQLDEADGLPGSVGVSWEGIRVGEIADGRRAASFGSRPESVTPSAWATVVSEDGLDDVLQLRLHRE